MHVPKGKLLHALRSLRAYSPYTFISTFLIVYLDILCYVECKKNDSIFSSLSLSLVSFTVIIRIFKTLCFSEKGLTGLYIHKVRT